MSVAKHLMVFIAVASLFISEAKAEELEEFKGYSPPPMFGGGAVSPTNTDTNNQPPPPAPAAPENINKNVQKVTVPTLTSEDLLNQPVTSSIGNDAMPQPALNPLAVPAPSVDLPVPLGQTVAPLAPAPIPSAPKAEPKEVKKAEPTKIIKPPIESKSAKKVEKEKPKKIVAPKKSIKESMPKVKSVPVEREKLDAFALPDTLPNEKLAPKPVSKNEQIIDKALEDKIIDPDVESLAKQMPTKNAEKPIPPKKETKPKVDIVSIEFRPNLTEIQDNQKGFINTDVVARLKNHKDVRLQILAFASTSKKDKDGARRISLSRALALRAYLVDNGIEPARLEVRALGDNTNEQPFDRVDLLFVGG